MQIHRGENLSWVTWAREVVALLRTPVLSLFLISANEGNINMYLLKPWFLETYLGLGEYFSSENEELWAIYWLLLSDLQALKQCWFPRVWRSKIGPDIFIFLVMISLKTLMLLETETSPDALDRCNEPPTTSVLPRILEAAQDWREMDPL